MFDLGVVIPVRRGSSRIQNKAMLPFGSEPSLIEWKLSQIVQVIDPKRIYLNSEDDEFLGLARRFGVSTIKRDMYLAKDHIASPPEMITGIVRPVPHAHIAWCTVVCPLMTPQEYLTSFRSYQDQVVAGGFDSLVGVNLTKEYFWDRNGALNYEANRNHTISQDLPDWYKVTNSIYMAPKRVMLDHEYFLGINPVLEPLSKFAAVDIDWIDDYRMARGLYGLYAEDGLGEIDRSTLIDWPQEHRLPIAV